MNKFKRRTCIYCPFEGPEAAVRFMENISISHEDKEKIFHSNTERIVTL